MVSHFRTRFSGDAGRDGRNAETVPQPLVSRREGRLHDGAHRAPAGHAHPGPEADSETGLLAGLLAIGHSARVRLTDLAVQRSVTNRPWRSGAQALALSGGEC